MSDFRMRTYQKNALSVKPSSNKEKLPVVKQAVLSPFTENEVSLSLYKDSQENLLKNWIENRLLSKEEWQEKRYPVKGGAKQSKEQAAKRPVVSSGSGFARQSDFSQLEKVAKFLLTLPKEKVSEIFKHLGKKEIEAIVKQMVRTPCLSNPVEIYELHQDFKKHLVQAKKQIKGGKQVAKSILEKAVGTQKTELLLRKVDLTQWVPFEFLQDLGEKEVWEVLKKESVSVLAVVFNFLNRSQAKYVVNKLEPTVQKDLLLRLARMERLHTDILRSVEETICLKAQQYLVNQSQTVQGKEVLAEILQYMEPTAEEKLVQSLDLELKQKEELNDLLFNMDIILRMQDEDLHKVLKDYSCVEIALLLKGKNEELKVKILSNLSKRRQEDVNEEFHAMGRVYFKEVNLITKRFLSDLKERHNNGRLTIFRKNEDFVS